MASPVVLTLRKSCFKYSKRPAGQGPLPFVRCLIIVITLFISLPLDLQKVHAVLNWEDMPGRKLVGILIHQQGGETMKQLSLLIAFALIAAFTLTGFAAEHGEVDTLSDVGTTVPGDDIGMAGPGQGFDQGGLGQPYEGIVDSDVNNTGSAARGTELGYWGIGDEKTGEYAETGAAAGGVAGDIDTMSDVGTTVPGDDTGMAGPGQGFDQGGLGQPYEGIVESDSNN